jgi:cell division protein FtsB
MYNSLSNFLLMVLIGLIAFIGKVIYNKIEKLIDEIRQIMISDMANKKDIESLKLTSLNHESRISKLENI